MGGFQLKQQVAKQFAIVIGAKVERKGSIVYIKKWKTPDLTGVKKWEINESRKSRSLSQSSKLPSQVDYFFNIF